MNTNEKNVFEFAQLLESHGLRCYGSDSAGFRTFIVYGNDTHVGYAQLSQFGMWSFSTVHKPCRQCGTSMRAYDHQMSPTLEAATQTMAMYAPHWASRADIDAVRKYSSIDDYVESQHFRPVRIVDVWSQN